MEDYILESFDDQIYEIDIPDDARESLKQELTDLIKGYVKDMTEEVKDKIESYRYEFSKEHIQDEIDDRRTQDYLERDLFEEAV